MSNGANSNTSGEDEARFRLKSAQENDRLPDWLAEELTRRGFVVFSITPDTKTVIQVEEPADKTVIWYRADPATGIPIGSALHYDTQQGKWVEDANTGSTYIPPARRYGKVSVAAGSSLVNIEYASLKTGNLHINLTPSTFTVSGFNSPPSSYPSSYGWSVTNLQETTATIDFKGIPTGGLTYFWEVVAIPD